MDHDTALITFILDESGSMHPIERAARNGFNAYREEQIAHGGETWWTLTTFNQKVRTRYSALPGRRVPKLGADYSPSGSTALYDAIGASIMKTRAHLSKLGTNRPADVIVVILTDGMENASREWTQEQVFELITESEAAGWQFIFLGANQDSWDVSQNLGIRRGTVVDWSPDARSHAHAIDEANLASSHYRTHGSPLSRYRDRRES
jgi:hypothetical protein